MAGHGARLEREVVRVVRIREAFARRWLADAMDSREVDLQQHGEKDRAMSYECPIRVDVTLRDSFLP